MYLIFNPGAQSGKSRDFFARIHAALAEREIDYRHDITTCLEDAEDLARQANLAGCKSIVAVGGDGTLNRVINGFYAPDGKRLSQARLGVIYTGTSPDFCLSHGLPVRDPGKAVEILAYGNVRSIGIGRIAYADGRLRHFACCANIGLGAQLARAANCGIRGRLGDKAGTFFSLLRVLKGYLPVDLVVNGQKQDGVFNLSIGKTRYVASGLKIANALKADDTRFYLLCIQNRIPFHLFHLYSGRPLALEYAECVDITGDAEVEFDGDACGKLPVRIAPAPPIGLIVSP